MLIDRTYFVSELNIPDRQTLAVGEVLDWFITKYEDQFLKEVFGYELYKAFKEGLQDDPVEDKWLDLVEGKEYTDRADKLKYWRGLTCTQSGDVDVYSSPIACYVYYWFIRNNHTQTASMGEVKAKTENATSHNPAFKMVRAWNEMAQSVCELVDFLESNKEVYTEWETSHAYYALNKFRPINEMNL